MNSFQNMMNNLSGKMQPEQQMEKMPQSAVDLLKADHRKVEGLFKKFEKTESAEEKKELLQTIIKELTVHSLAEEQLVYPIIEEEEQDTAYEAEEEHHVVEMLLAELSRVKKLDEKLSAKVKVLSELVQHHVKEEEGELFPMLEKTDVDLNDLGQKIENKKQQLMKNALKLAAQFWPGSAQPSNATKGGSTAKSSGSTRRAASGKATASRQRAGQTKKSSASQKRNTGSAKQNVRSIKTAKSKSAKPAAKRGRATTAKAASTRSRKPASSRGSKSRSGSGRSRRAS